MRLRHRHLPLQAYLLSLLLAGTLIGVGLTLYQAQLRVDRARSVAGNSLSLAARLGARDIADAMTATKGTVAQVAANPALTALFTTPTPKGCSLAFSGAGPFTRGHIDIVARTGKVLCSSRDLPGGASYTGQPWLTSTTPRVVGPVNDSGTRSFVVLSPIADLGVVAAFLDAGSVTHDLTDRYSTDGSTRFDLLFNREQTAAHRQHESDLIYRDAPVRSLGLVVRADIPQSQSLAYAIDVNREMRLFLLGALFLVFVLLELVHLGIVRPIRRLSASVREATAGHADVQAPTTGPSEVVRLAEDFVTLTRTVTSELSQRRQAETEAAASEQTYRTMFEANPQPTWVHHADTGRLLAVNAAMVERFGWTREELLAMTCYDLVADSSQTLTGALTGGLFGEQIGADRVERSGPWALRDRDGTSVDCLITSATLQLPGAPGRIVVAEDVTRRLHTERLLQRTLRMESLGQLAGGIAHDFNNLLTAISSYADLADGTIDAGSDPRLAESIGGIRGASDQAARLTQQLLAFSRQQVLKPEIVCANDVVEEHVPMLRRLLGEEIDVQLSLDRRLGAAKIDPGLLSQVLMNLSVNARDAMPAGGVLTIATENVDLRGAPTIGGPGNGQHVMLSVSDTGDGIDDATLARIFEPFFTTKDPGKGTGLGLPTVIGIVEQSGGRVAVQTEQGSGTTFTVYLPVVRQAVTSRTSAPEARIDRPAGHERILLVEDNEIVRGPVTLLLEELGYDVVAAEGPTEALALAASGAPLDLLLTDVVMPGMNGRQLAERLRELQPGLKVLFMSGYTDDAVIARGVIDHEMAFLQKPFGADQLAQTVAELFSL
jgi:two-component system, cell cycle sensor histidine kinase and response regulator CckA